MTVQELINKLMLTERNLDVVCDYDGEWVDVKGIEVIEDKDNKKLLIY